MVLLQFEMSWLVWFWFYDTQLKISLIYTFFDINNFRYDTVRVHWLPIKFRSVVPYTLPGYFHDHSSGIAQSRFPFAGVITFSLLESDRVMPVYSISTFLLFYQSVWHRAGDLPDSQSKFACCTQPNCRSGTISKFEAAPESWRSRTSEEHVWHGIPLYGHV